VHHITRLSSAGISKFELTGLVDLKSHSILKLTGSDGHAASTSIVITLLASIVIVVFFKLFVLANGASDNRLVIF